MKPAMPDPKSRPARHAFTWRAYLTSIALACASLVAAGLAIDKVLSQNGIEIQIGREALVSAFVGLVFMTPGVLLAWRVGLVTLFHYLLGVILLFFPATLITLAIYPVLDAWIIPPESVAREIGTFSAFVRLLRAVVLAPISMLSFWFSYHVLFKSDPRR
jgi:hypothetical protein